METELWQLFNEQGVPIAGKGATKPEVTSMGLLHGVSHVWMWRRGRRGPEILVQRRGADKRTWPNMWDVSVAGHIRLGEPPLVAAQREISEELGLQIQANRLELFAVFRWDVSVEQSDLIENEFQWLYLLELSESKFTLPAGEVGEVAWKPLAQFRAEVKSTTSVQNYVLHGETYFAILLEAIDSVAS